MTVEGWLAMGEAALCGFAIRRRRQFPIGAGFPLVPALLLAHLMLFGLPAALFRDEFLGLGSGTLWSIAVPETISPATLRQTAMVVFAAMLALLVGYELPMARMLVAPLPALRVAWRRNPMPGALILMAGGLIAAVLEKGTHSESLEGILGMFSFVGLWAMGALWLLNWRGVGDRWTRLAAWTMTAALVGLEVIQGALWRPLIDLVLLFVIYLRARGRMPWFAIALAIPAFLAMAATKIVFRTLLPSDQWRNTRAVDKLEIYGRSLKLAWDDPVSLEFGETLLSRMSETWVLAVVVERSPRFVPYWNGATYSTAGWSFVPRLLAPDKPRETTGQDFPHRYGITAPDDDQTSTNFAALIELYANFGPVGAVLGMMLFGIACRGLERLFADARFDDATYALAAPVLASLLLIEQPFHGAFGGFVQHTPFLILILELCGICAISIAPATGASIPETYRQRARQQVCE